MQFTITQDQVQIAGTILAFAAVVFLASRHFGTVKGLFSGWYLPSITKPEDPRVCLMHDWDHFSDELVANGADAEDVEGFAAKTVWPTIQKAPKEPPKGIPEVAMDGKPFGGVR